MRPFEEEPLFSTKAGENANRVLYRPPEKNGNRDTVTVFLVIFAFGKLNLLRKLNWLSPAKLPAGSRGEYNSALCVSTEFRCFEETISLRSNLANKESMGL